MANTTWCGIIATVKGIGLWFLILTALCGLSARGVDHDIRVYGAVGDGETKDTLAIQHAVDACAACGDRVVFPRGTFLSGPIRLKSGVELHFAEGSVLLASPDLSDYPEWTNVRHIAYPKALPRMRNASFLFADEAHDIAFTGSGVIDSNGERFVRLKKETGWTGWQYERSVPMTNSLPRVLFLTGCSNVVVRGITIRNPPAGWSTWFHDCDNVLIENARVEANVRYPNNDGFHVNSCRNVMIRNCDIETGDDSIVVRANNRSLAENRVCENVVVSNCTLRSWASGIRIAWANDGTIRNCLFKDIRMRDTNVGVAMVLPPVGGWNAYDYGREATRLEDLTFEDIDMDGIYARPILSWIASADEGTKCDGFHNIVFRNVRSRGLEVPLFKGRPDCLISGIVFDNCRFDTVGDDVLPDYRHHGAASWDRRPGETNMYFSSTQKTK